MHEYAILFTYYGDAPKGVVAQNLARMRRFNPEAPIIPLLHDGASFVEGTIDVRQFPCPWNTNDKWRSCDTMIYRWFLHGEVPAKRYVVLEWDTYSNASVPDFYADVWNADVAAVEAFGRDEKPDWWSFRELPALGELAPHAGGVVPFSGTLLSHAALNAICRGPLLKDVFCELRLATLARHAGFQLTPMPFAHGFMSFDSRWVGALHRPGIYHPIKRLVAADGSAIASPPPRTPSDIATRTDVINFLVSRFALTTYLELGVDNPQKNFDNVMAPERHGVDPWAATFRMTTDEFFGDGLGLPQYDLVFVDAFHEEEQCLRDMEHALERLSPGGFVVVHDANPPTEWHQRPPDAYSPGSIWNGTVWKAVVRFRQRHPECSTMTVDVDWGCAVIRRSAPGEDAPPFEAPATLDWPGLERHRREWLNLVSVAEFCAAYAEGGPPVASRGESNLGKWDLWYRALDASSMGAFRFGDTVTYRMAAAFLADVDEIEDWGCGAAGFKRFYRGRYVGVDGSRTPFADKLVDLCQYQSRTPGILLRHVLEHNYRWEAILDNALRSFDEKLCLVLFTPLGDRTREIAHNRQHGVDVPDLSLSREDIERKLTGLRWELISDIATETGYGVEHVYLVWREGRAPTPLVAAGGKGGRPKRVIYTAVFGGFDDLQNVAPQEGVDLICYTDDKTLRDPRWQVLHVDPRYAHPRLAAKYYKAMPHLVLPDYDETLWVDASFRFTDPHFARDAFEHLDQASIALCLHPDRTCIYDEGAYCQDWPKYRQQDIAGQLAHYRAQGFPTQAGLYAGGIIARRNGDPAIRHLNELWMAENERWSYQDQLSLPYLFWKLGIKPAVFRQHLWRPRWGTWLPHASDR